MNIASHSTKTQIRIKKKRFCVLESVYTVPSHGNPISIMPIILMLMELTIRTGRSRVGLRTALC